MPWSIILHPNDPFVETRYVGSLSPPELAEAVHETLRTVEAHKRHLVLGDCSKLEGGHSLFDLYGLADAVLASGLAHLIREAIILPALPGAVEDVRFWETTCMNRGIVVRIFTTREEALAWLLERKMNDQ